MSDACSLAKTYFALSNQHDLDAVAELFTESSTYSSHRTGVYFGREAIMEMQHAFHAKFNELTWTIDEIEEDKPGVVRIGFTMQGEMLDGSTLNETGIEYVVVHEGKLRHVEVRPASSST